MHPLQVLLFLYNYSVIIQIIQVDFYFASGISLHFNSWTASYHYVQIGLIESRMTVLILYNGINLVGGMASMYWSKLLNLMSPDEYKFKKTKYSLLLNILF